MGLKGYKHTPEAIAKISAASIGNKWNVGKRHSLETRNKRSASMMGVHLGRRHTEQSRRHMSLAHTGKKQSPESIAKRVAKLIGRKLPPRSAEHCLKISIAKKGTPCPEHVKRLVSFAHTGKSISNQTRLNMSIAQKTRAKQNNFYIDGRCKERMAERRIVCQSFEYKQWRRAVFTRDGYICQECGVRGGCLHADHVKAWSSHPELRYEVLNGKTLCAPCHRNTETWGSHRTKVLG